MAALPKVGPAVLSSAEETQHPSSVTALREGGEDLPETLNHLLEGVTGRSDYLRRVKIFLYEYLLDLNGTRAASIAWPEAQSRAGVRAYECLHDPQIRAAVDRALDERRQAFMVEDATLTRSLAETAFANMQDYVTVQPDGTAYIDLNSLSRSQFAAIQEINTEEVMEGRGEDGRTIRKVKIKLHERCKATELLMRKLGMLKENTTTVNVLVGLAERLAEAKEAIEGEEVEK